MCIYETVGCRRSVSFQRVFIFEGRSDSVSLSWNVDKDKREYLVMPRQREKIKLKSSKAAVEREIEGEKGNERRERSEVDHPTPYNSSLHQSPGPGWHPASKQ